MLVANIGGVARGCSAAPLMCGHRVEVGQQCRMGRGALEAGKSRRPRESRGSLGLSADDVLCGAQVRGLARQREGHHDSKERPQGGHERRSDGGHLIALVTERRGLG